MRMRNSITIYVWTSLVLAAFCQHNDTELKINITMSAENTRTEISDKTGATQESKTETAMTFVPDLLNIVTSTTLTVIPELATTPTPVIQTSSIAPVVNKSVHEMTVPKSCENRTRSHHQPLQTNESAISKCCPIGQSIQRDVETNRNSCQDSSHKLNVIQINALFYEKCIEDLETNLTLPVVYRNPCSDKQVIFGNVPDERIYVIQNGSLLIIDSGFAWFDITNDYCLEVDAASGQTLAFVCYQGVVVAGFYIFSVCMFISVPFLLAVSFLYTWIKELRDLPGKCLACLSLTLACGFFVMSVTQLVGKPGHEIHRSIGYLGQFFFLSYFFWLLVMFIDISLHLWLFIPRLTKLSETQKQLHFIGYSILATGIPAVLVTLAAYQNLNGTPPYFLRNANASEADSQKYFVPPVSFVMFACFFIMVSWHFGFKIVGEIVQVRSKISPESTDKKNFENFRKMTKSIVHLYIVMLINWIFEIVSFYGHNFYALFDALISLQGVMIFIIFTLSKFPKVIIREWYTDSGSYTTDERQAKENIPLKSRDVA